MSNRLFFLKKQKRDSGAFQRIFNSSNEDVKVVIKYLQDYCHLFKTTDGNDILEGRRQALLEILRLSKFEPEVLIAFEEQQQKQNAIQQADDGYNDIF